METAWTKYVTILLTFGWLLIATSFGHEDELTKYTDSSKSNSEKEQCRCKPCMTGPNCEESLAYYDPRFSLRFQSIDVTDGDLLYNATTYPHVTGCECHMFEYDIIDVENVNEPEETAGIFEIDRYTGRLTMNTDTKYVLFKVTVAVRNTATGATDETKLFIDNMAQNQPNDFYPLDQSGYSFEHHIEKRSVIHATDVNFTVTKLTAASGTLEVGSRVRFEVAIIFPAADMDMLVEIFAPDNETTVMILCDVVQTHKGSNLATALPGTPVLDSKENDIVKKPDRAIIDYGVVTNSEADINDIEQSTIRIEYEAVMILNPDTVNGATYWISLGAEYNNENEIYVVQYSETVDTSNAAPATGPTFTVHGPPSLAIGSSYMISLDMYIPYASAEYTLRAFTPIDTVGQMSVCYSKFDSYEANFNCGNDQSAITTALDADLQGPGNSQGTLYLNHLLNKGSRDATPVVNDNKISSSFVVHVYDDVSLVGTDLQMGMALEVDTNEIWVGNLNITVDPAATSGFAIPTLDSYTTSLTSWEATIGEPFWVKFKVRVPPPTVAGVASHYILELLAPFQSNAPVFQVCELKVLTVGSDMPCMKIDDIRTDYSTRETDGSFADRAVTDLGYITNLEINQGTDDDIIEVEAVMTPLAGHPDATLNSFHVATFGITVGGSYVSIMSMNVKLVGTSTLTQVTNTTAPSFTIDYWDSVTDIPVLGTTKVNIAMTTGQNIFYPAMDLEFLMPSDTTNVFFHICKAKVESVGENNPCLTKDWVNKNTQSYSQFEDDIDDRLTLDMGQLCNYQFVNDVNEDVSTFALYMKVLDLPVLTDNSQHWVSTGIRYDSDRLYVGQLSANVRRGLTYSPSATIYSTLQRNDTTIPLPIGYYGKFSLMLKIPNGDVFDLKVAVTSSAQGLDICSVRVIAAGDNLPCLVDEVTTKTETYWGNGGVSAVTSDFGVVTNFGSLGLISNDVFDDNTAIIEIMTYANPLVTTNGNYDLNVDTYLDTAQSNVVSHSITGIATTTDMTSINTVVTSAVSIGLAVGEIAGGDTAADIAAGEAKRIVMTAVIPEGSIYDLEFAFIIPNSFIGKIEICDAAITSVGKNLPCVDGTIEAVKSSQTGTYTDTATFTMNYVCNSAMLPGDTGANSIIFEAFVRVVPNSLAAVGDTVTITGTVKAFTSTLTVESLDLTVTDAALHTPLVKSLDGVTNLTLISIDQTSPLPMTIGQNVTIGVNVSVPAYSSSKLEFDVELPDDGYSACMTVVSITVVGSPGRNVMCVEPEVNNKGVVYTPTYSNTVGTGTGQNTYGYLDLGIVTNTGLSYRLNNFVAGDDDVRLDVIVQMSDCSLSTNAHVFDVSIGNKVANYVFIYNTEVSVSRDGLEKPDILMSLGFAPESTSSVVVLEGQVYHTNLSTAEGKNTSVSVALPEYLTTSGAIVTTSAKAYTVATDKVDLLEISFTDFFFADVFTFKATLGIDSSFELPSGFGADDSRFIYWTETDFVIRSNSYDAEDWFPSYVNGQDVAFYSVYAGTGAACSSALGMSSLAIQDCQITGTIGRSNDGYPRYGRKGGANAWKPVIRNSAFARNRFFEVYFGNKVKVTQIDVEQNSGAAHFATEFDIEYSLDGYSWFGKESASIGPSPGSVEVILLGNKIDTRYIRLTVTNDTSYSVKSELGIKFEFYGCQVTSDVTTSQACTNAAVTTNNIPTGFYTRSFVADVNSQVYVCDRSANSLEFRGNCITSSDTGTTWQELDRNLASMIGFESSQGRIYGYGQDKQTVLMSTDSGVTWESTTSDELTSDQQLTTWTSAINVVEDASVELDRTSPHFSYTIGSWGATYYSMYYNNAAKFKWIE